MKLDKQKVLKNLGLCTRCRQCRMVCEIPIATTMLPICPTGEYFKWDTYFASGRVALAKKILLDKIEFDETILKSLYTCTLCGSCVQQCPILNFNPLEAVMVLRQIAVEKGLADEYYHMPDLTPIAFEGGTDPKSGTALFVGTAAQSDLATVQAVSGALTKAGIQYKTCSGIDAGEYLIRKGDIDAFEALKASNIQKFKDAGIKTLITHDPLTYFVLSGKDYNLADAGISVVFYLSLLADKGIFEKKVDGIPVMLHDNSSLGRGMGVYDLPRDILTQLGYKVVEPLRTKENAMSCGAYPDCLDEVADLSSAYVLEDAASVGAQQLITVGRNDARQLERVAKGNGSSITVRDIAFLI